MLQVKYAWERDIQAMRKYLLEVQEEMSYQQDARRALTASIESLGRDYIQLMHQIRCAHDQLQLMHGAASQASFHWFTTVQEPPQDAQPQSQPPQEAAVSQLLTPKDEPENHDTVQW